MGIFKWLAGKVTTEKAEEETEERLLIAALVNLKKALKYTDKTLKEITKIEKKIHSLKLFTLQEKRTLSMYHLKIINEGVNKIIIPLDFTNKCLESIKEKIEARKAVSSGYRRAVYSEKDRLLLNLVERVSERDSEMIENLIAGKEEVKRNHQDIMIPTDWGFSHKSINITVPEESFPRSKRMIEKSIKDLENALASQA
ncbi:MAG: hypothetical protein Q7S55_02860 [Nanoarchaeota archaeon]|nr:hypothetical protein [Nanoarchaeota archaeon]